MTEESPSGEETAAVEALALPGKCTRQDVRIAVLKPKYLSNLTRTDLFTVENVFLSTENPEKTDTKCYLLNWVTSTLISFPFFKNQSNSGYIFFLTRYLLHLKGALRRAFFAESDLSLWGWIFLIQAIFFKRYFSSEFLIKGKHQELDYRIKTKKSSAWSSQFKYIFPAGNLLKSSPNTFIKNKNQTSFFPCSDR